MQREKETQSKKKTAAASHHNLKNRQTTEENNLTSTFIIRATLRLFQLLRCVFFFFLFSFCCSRRWLKKSVCAQRADFSIGFKPTTIVRDPRFVHMCAPEIFFHFILNKLTFLHVSCYVCSLFQHIQVESKRPPVW